jgi:hypothetical protein
MPTYDADLFDPPAAVAYVTLRNPVTGITWPDVPMLLDSGADVTLIPQTLVELLEAEIVPDRKYELAGFDGTTSLASVVRLEVTFCRRIFRGQFLLVEQPWGILGRNIMNAVSLVLDGPRLMRNEL